MKIYLLFFQAFLLAATSSFAAESSIELKYSTETIQAISLGAETEIEAVIFIPQEVAKKYAGQHLTQIKVGVGVNLSANTKVIIRESLDGEPVYEQLANFDPLEWNVITLNKPYEIKGNAGFYFGYSLVSGSYGVDYAIGIDNSPYTNLNGDLFRVKFVREEVFSDWMHLSEDGFSNLCIAGIVAGNQPLREMDFYSLSTPSVIDMNKSFSISGKAKNLALAPVNEFELAYKIGENAKVIRSYSGLNIQPGENIDFEITGIDFEKTVDRKYPIVVSIDKVNGGDDEYPENNTQSATIWTWDIPSIPTVATTQALKKNVILEEFTGVRCTYCPDGHKIANQIATDNPGRVAVINIHQGNFAIANPNYRTEWGDAIAKQTGIEGYPAGTVNRHVFSGKNTTLSRNNFAPRTKTILGQDAYVNIGLKTTLNEETRELLVDVELYYTQDGSSVNMLNIALLQDSILGPQLGAEEFYPEMMVGDLYQHNHMLRDLLTKQWGDSVKTTSAQTFVARRYIYTVPEKIGDVPVNLKKIEIVAFVAEGTQEIITGTSSKFNGGINSGLPSIDAQDIHAYIWDGSLYIDSTVPVQRATIYNLSGQKVLAISPADKIIPVGMLTPGMYVVKLKTAENEKVFKVIR